MIKFNNGVVIIGCLLLAVAIISFLFGVAANNPKIEALDTRTPLSKYLFSVLLAGTGVLLILAGTRKKNQISN